MMANKNTKKYKNFFIKLFFILYTFVYPVKIESNLDTPPDYRDYPDQPEIEPVVTEAAEYNLTVYQLNTSPKQITDFALAKVDISAINKYSLIHYNNYVLHQLKLFKHPITPHQQLLSILQKSNIWHQSSAEDSPLLGLRIE